MSKNYSMQGPDGKTYSIMGPDNADPNEVKKRIISQYKTAKPAPPTMGQRVKGLASKEATKIGGEIGNKFPFMKGGDTWPEIAGQVGGGIAGETLGGTTGAIIGGGAGQAAATGLEDLPTNLLSMHFPKARQELGQKMKRGFDRGTTFSALGETLPIAWRGAKALGREFESGISSLSGVTDRVAQLRRLPLWEQIKVLLPGHGRIPSPEAAGVAQGAVEERLGVPTLKQVTKERVYAEPKGKGEGVGGTGIKIKDIIKSLKLKGKEVEDFFEKIGVEQPPEISPKTGESTPVMRRVKQAFTEKVEPTINDAVQALRDTFYRAGKLAKDDPAGVVYAEEAAKINKYLESKVEELAKARKLTHLAHLRDELFHLLPQTPKGEPYRFGVMRLFWRATMLLGSLGMMSPWGSGASAVAGDVITKMLDPILANKATGSLAAGGLQALQKRRNPPPAP